MNIFIIAGPSGVGKSYLISELVKKNVYPLEVYTDRLRRPSELQISDRVYLTKAEFDASINEFLYWFQFQDFRYGYKSLDIEKQKKQNNSIAFNIPPSFLTSIIQKIPDAIVILLNIESNNFDLLKDRMIQRDLSKNDSPQIIKSKMIQINNRLEYAKKENQEMKLDKADWLKNAKSKTFTIKDDQTLFNEVIPYIEKQLKIKDVN